MLPVASHPAWRFTFLFFVISILMVRLLPRGHSRLFGRHGVCLSSIIFSLMHCSIRRPHVLRLSSSARCAGSVGISLVVVTFLPMIVAVFCAISLCSILSLLACPVGEAGCPIALPAVNDCIHPRSMALKILDTASTAGCH